MAPPTRLKRADNTLWIEGVPTLTGWRKLPTFVGALDAALSVTEHPVSYIDLLGLSGLAFRTRWYAGPDGPTGCPCSPTGETPMVWSAIGRGTGWQLEPFDGDGWNAPGMRRIVPRIVDSIDAGRPVIAVDRDLNSGVIYGHKQDRVTFLVRTYTQDTVQCERLGAGPRAGPGCVSAPSRAARVSRQGAARGAARRGGRLAARDVGHDGLVLLAFRQGRPRGVD